MLARRDSTRQRMRYINSPSTTVRKKSWNDAWPATAESSSRASKICVQTKCNCGFQLPCEVEGASSSSDACESRRIRASVGRFWLLKMGLCLMAG